MASWQETSPGHFERPCDSMERFFLTLARATAPLNREHWSINIVAHIEMKTSIELTESALKHGWKTMRYDHPEIACIERGNTKVYEVPNAAALDAWLDQTFIVASGPATKEELIESIRPSALATLYYLSHTSEIIIHISHWRIDFIGGLSLLHNLLTACVEPRQVHFGDEGKNLSPSRDEAAKFTPSDVVHSPEMAEEREKAVTDLLMQIVGNLPSLGLPVQNSRQLPNGTLRSEVKLEASTTSAIISACKTRGLTVTTALHAALLVATQQVAPASLSSSTYTSLGLFNIRPLLSAPYNDSTRYPAVPQIIGIPLSLQPSNYADLVAQLKPFYGQKIPPSPGSRMREDVIIPTHERFEHLAGQPPPADLPAPSEPILSSMGIVDRYLKRDYGDIIEVKDFWIGLEMDTTQLVCYLWTWQGKMTLSAVYNQTFYERHFIQGFLKRVLDILFAELEIQGA